MLFVVAIAISIFFLIGAIASVILANFVRSKHPPAGQFIDVDYQGQTVRLHYLDSVADKVSSEIQNKPCIVLIHGATGNLHDFAASIFKPLCEKYRVIAFDRPGLGYSQRPRHGDSRHWCSPKEQMVLIRNAIQALKIEQPFVLGHSFAGSIVLDYMMQHADEISGGILLSPVSHPWPSGVTWYNYLDKFPLFRELMAYTWFPILGYFGTSSGLKVLFAPESVPQNYRQKIALDLFFRPRLMLDNFRDLRLLCEYVTIAGRGYRGITTPVQIISGTEDDVVSSWLHSEKLSYELQNVKWLDLPKLGHSPHHSRTQEIVNNIDAFIVDNIQV